MHGTYERRLSEQSEIQRNILQGTAHLCSECKFGIAWKALFKSKAAEALAAITGCSVRTANYQLSGEHRLGAPAIKALFDEIMSDQE